MKNRVITTILTVVLLTASFHVSASFKEYRNTKTKKIERALKGSSGVSDLSIKNTFGHVVITTWEQNYVDFDITITCSGDDAKKVSELLSKIDVNLTLIGTKASAQTVIQGKNSNQKNLNMKIDYIVKMPKSATLTVNNSFGNTNVASIDAATKFIQSFGNLTIGNLSKQSEIKIEFGNINIQNAETLNLKMSFAKSSTLGSVNNLTLTADFSSIQADRINNASIASEQSKIRVTDLGSCNFTKSSFTTLNVEKLTSLLTIPKASFSNITVENVAQSVKEINISSDFTPIRIGVDNSNNLSLDLSTSFGKIEISPSVEFKMSDFSVERSIQKRVGSIGNSSSPSGKIIIKGEHKNIIIGK